MGIKVLNSHSSIIGVDSQAYLIVLQTMHTGELWSGEEHHLGLGWIQR